MEWITGFSSEPSVNAGVTGASRPKGRYLLQRESSNPGSVRVHPGLRWTLREYSRAGLPTGSTLRSAIAARSCGWQPWCLPTCSRQPRTYLLCGSSGTGTPDSSEIVLWIPADKNHTRKLQKVHKSPDKQLKLLTIL